MDEALMRVMSISGLVALVLAGAVFTLMLYNMVRSMWQNRGKTEFPRWLEY